MDMLIERIETAKNNNDELERLISDYMPFIVKTVSGMNSLGMEYDDRLSLAMLSFMNCVKQYEAGKGNFITFTAHCIRNRLIDESRKLQKHSGKVIPMFLEKDDQRNEMAEDKAAIAAYSLEQEQESLAYEIEAFSVQLGEYGITFRELPRICPKQERSRRQCLELGRFVANNGEMRETLLRHHRLSQGELVKSFGLSEKTIEKHRKYIVTIVILLADDYPLIRAFLPQYREVKR